MPETDKTQAENATWSSRVHIMFMTKASNNDVFLPVVWASEKAKEYWLGVANQDLWMHVGLMESYCLGVLTGEKLR